MERFWRIIRASFPAVALLSLTVTCAKTPQPPTELAAGDVEGMDICSNNSDLYVTGYAEGSTGFGSSTGSFDQGGKDFFILSLDFNGTVNWTRTYGSEVNYGLGGYIIELEDGSLVFCGTVNFENNNLKIALYKTDSEGNLDL